MSPGARDLAGARSAAAGFLASIGAISLITWSLSEWLADFAIYPADPALASRDGDFGFAYSTGEQVADMKRDYRWFLTHGAVRLAAATGLYWLLAFVLGATRRGPNNADMRAPTLLLAAALLLGMVFVFLRAAPRLLFGPMIDACTARYARARPDDGCLDCGIHSCEGSIGLYWGLASTVLVLGLLAASLWMRRRQALANRSADHP